MADGLTVNSDGSVSIGTPADVGNIRISGNTISSTDANGDIILSPDGTGSVILGTPLAHTSGGTGLSSLSPNLKLFANTEANGFELASGLKVGVITRDTSLASGTQAVTGVGFKPSAVLFLLIGNGYTTEMSLGLDDGSSHFSVANLDAEISGMWYKSSLDSLWACQDPNMVRVHGV